MVHVWVGQSIPADATRMRPAVFPPTLEARLADGGDRSDPIAGHHIQEIRAASAASSSAVQYGSGNDRPSAREPPRVQPPPALDVASAREQARLAPAPLDPVYYPARELDVYPTPLVPLRFEYPPHLAHAPIAGNVRATLMVGESGVVDRVAVLTAEPAGYFEEHTRAMLASARFHPGYKAGRAVRSQITVSVEYSPAARAAVSR